jgi:hypothetical protein
MSVPTSIQQQLNNVQSNILNYQQKINEQNSLIDKKANQLEGKQKQVFGQSQEIDDKLKLLETRNRMLQLSIERNVYKKKVIYSLLAVIVALIMGMLVFYAFYNRTMVPIQ